MTCFYGWFLNSEVFHHHTFSYKMLSTIWLRWPLTIQNNVAGTGPKTALRLWYEILIFERCHHDCAPSTRSSIWSLFCLAAVGGEKRLLLEPIGKGKPRVLPPTCGWYLVLSGEYGKVWTDNGGTRSEAEKMKHKTENNNRLYFKM